MTAPKSTLPSDESLAALAASGDALALEALLRRHQRWVFNLALYMLQAPLDAEDASQEILLKITTGLSAFKGLSAFRTWAHRIAVNHILDRRRSRAELTVTGFECFAHYLEAAPDQDLPEPKTPETALLVEEARRMCTMGMLLCLDREQRIVFLLGEILETGDSVGAELLQLSRDNFRQRLARAREQLATFMSSHCGLVNPRNPCRCARKTQAFIRDGIVDPVRLQFVDARVDRVRKVAAARGRQLSVVQEQAASAMRDLYPLVNPPDVAARIRQIIEAPQLRQALELEGNTTS